MGYEYEAVKKSSSTLNKVKNLASKVKNVNKIKNILPKNSKTQESSSFAPTAIRKKTSVSSIAPESYKYQSSKSSKLSKLNGGKVSSLLTENKVLVVGVVIILAAIVVIGSNITGYLTYSEFIAVELNETQHTLNETIADFSVCQNDLISCASTRTAAENELSDCKVDMSFYQGKYDSLSMTYEELKTNYDDLRGDYDNLASLVNQLRSLLTP